MHSATGHRESAFRRCLKRLTPQGTCRIVFPFSVTMSTIPGIIPLPEMLTQYPGLYLKISDLPPSCPTSDKPRTIPRGHPWEAKRTCLVLTPVLQLEETGSPVTSSSLDGCCLWRNSSWLTPCVCTELCSVQSASTCLRYVPSVFRTLWESRHQPESHRDLGSGN